MKNISIKLLSLFISFCFVSCGNSQKQVDAQDANDELQERIEQLEQENQKLKQSESSAVKTFKTNKGNIPYERALNYSYQLGYEHGIIARNNTLPNMVRESHMKNFESLWTGLYGIPTSTEESRKAYEASFENYKKGYDETFFKK